MKKKVLLFSIIVIASGVCVAQQTSRFTYQGKLGSGGAPANGLYQFECKLFDAVTGPNQIGSTQTVAANVMNGVFTTELDFGVAAFRFGEDRWLEIGVRLAGSGDAYTVMSPRQQIRSVPFAVHSLTAETADTANNLVASAAANFVTISDARLSDARTPTAGSTAYIQNQNAVFQPGNFTIDGTGTAIILRAENQFNIGAERVLSIGAGSTSNSIWNLFAGVGAGQNDTGAGSGAANSFFGFHTGFSNTSGAGNAFVGYQAGSNNTSGINNTFVGQNSGLSNTDKNANTFIGSQTNGAAGITNATAIGSQASVTQSNSLVLGNGVNVGIGTTAPQYALHVVGQNVRVENGSFPRFSLNVTGNAHDEGRWQNYATTGALNFSALNDAENAETFWLQVSRGSGTSISSVIFPNGNVVINQLGTAGTDHLCRNALNQISSCSSSIRYKQNVNSFTQGLSLIKRLRPVSFNWRANNQADLGLVAEEVNKIEPLLTTTNDKGEVEGVKYDRVGVVLVNAVQEQQLQIEAQQKQISEQQKLIEELKALVCSQNQKAGICKLNN